MFKILWLLYPFMLLMFILPEMHPSLHFDVNVLFHSMDVNALWTGIDSLNIKMVTVF